MNIERRNAQAGRKSSIGYTLIELLITIFVVVIMPLLLLTGVMGNFWYTRSGVLEKIQLENRQVIRILDDQRNVWSESVFIADENSKRIRYCLDTNVLYNYKVKKCSG